MRPLNRLTFNEKAFAPPVATIRSAGLLLVWALISFVALVAIVALPIGVAFAVIRDGRGAIVLLPVTMLALYGGAGFAGQLVVAVVGASRAMRSTTAAAVAGWTGRTIDLVDTRHGPALVGAYLNAFGWVPPWRVLIAEALIGLTITMTAAATFTHWALALVAMPLAAAAVLLVVWQVRWTRARQIERAQRA